MPFSSPAAADAFRAGFRRIAATTRSEPRRFAVIRKENRRAIRRRTGKGSEKRVLVGKMGSNSGKSTIFGGPSLNHLARRIVGLSLLDRNISLSWGYVKSDFHSLLSAFQENLSHNLQPPNIVNLPEFKGVFATRRLERQQNLYETAKNRGFSFY